MNDEYQSEFGIIKNMRLAGEADEKILQLLETRAVQNKFKGAFKQSGQARNNSKGVIPYSSCTGNDIGVELGNFGSWTAEIANINSTGSLPPCQAAPWSATTLPLAGRITVAPPPSTDPCANAPGFPINLPAPQGGNFSIQLGNMNINSEAERIIHSFIVQPKDSDFTYQYAVVFEDPGHLPSNQPYFEFIILAQNGDTVPCSFQHVVAGTPGFYTSTSGPNCQGSGFGASYKPWTTVGIDLSAYIGQQATIIATTADCSQCGHFGYAYLDFTCGIAPTQAGCVGIQSTICAEQGSGYTYQWSNGASTQCITAMPSNTDTFLVQVTPPSGCPFWQKLVPVNSAVLANYSINQNVNIVTFTNLSSGALTYYWDFGDGTFSTQQDPVHTYSTSGTYTVCLTAGLPGCDDTMCSTVLITTLAAGESISASGVALFPNPASEELMIEIEASWKSGMEITIVDLVGKVSARTTVTGHQARVTMRDFANGIYFVQVRTASGLVTKKIIIDK